MSKGYGKRETVTNIRGTKVKSLTEGNNLAKETKQKATSAANYVGDVFQGEKSLGEIGQDLQAAGTKVGESVMQDYVIPVGVNWLHHIEDKYGGKEAKLKRTLEESYQRGRNRGRVDVIGAEVIASGLSGGMGGAAIKTVTTAAKLKPDGPNRDRTPEGNGRDGSNGSDGNGTPLFGLFDSIKKDMETLDGKFKTKAKTVEDALKEMQEMVNSFLAAMQGFSNLVPDTGRPMSFSLDGNGGGGHNNNHGNHGNNRNKKPDNEGTDKAKYDYKKVEEVENRIRHESKEHGQFFDKDGNLIGDTVIGTEKAIDVSDYRDRGKDAVFTHNHPTNGPFSLEDMMVAVDFDMLEMRAITPNGKTFSMTRGIDGWKVDGQSVRMVYRLVQEELRADVNFNKLYKEGRMDEAWDMFYDKVAERIGGEYKRK